MYNIRGFAAVNILGLAMGFAAFILTAIYIHYETSFERFHSKSGRIFRPTYAYDSGNGYDVHWARITVTYFNELPNSIPEIKQLIRFQNHERKYVRVGENKFRPGHVYITNHEIFKVFDLSFISGDPMTSLMEPYSIVLTESLARQYFGSIDVLNKEIFVLGDWSTEETAHVVTGIFKDLPSNTHLPIDMLISFENQEARSGWAYVYVLLAEGADIENVEAKMSDFIQQHANEHSVDKVAFDFQPLPDIHLHSNLAREIIPNGNFTYIKIFSAVGIFILLVALVNYINLNSAMMFGRSREVGLRKILEADHKQVASYLLFESIAYSLLATLLAACIVIIAFPYFDSLTGTELLINPWRIGLGMMSQAVICGLIISK